MLIVLKFFKEYNNIVLLFKKGIGKSSTVH